MQRRQVGVLPGPGRSCSSPFVVGTPPDAPAGGGPPVRRRTANSAGVGLAATAGGSLGARPGVAVQLFGASPRAGGAVTPRPGGGHRSSVQPLNRSRLGRAALRSPLRRRAHCAQPGGSEGRRPAPKAGHQGDRARSGVAGLDLAWSIAGRPGGGRDLRPRREPRPFPAAAPSHRSAAIPLNSASGPPYRSRARAGAPADLRARRPHRPRPSPASSPGRRPRPAGRSLSQRGVFDYRHLATAVVSWRDGMRSRWHPPGRMPRGRAKAIARWRPRVEIAR